MRGLKAALRPMHTWAGRKFFPKQYWKYYIREIIRRKGEGELALLPALVRFGTTGADIGAAEGLYALHLLELGANVIAFEPRLHQAKALSEMAAALGLALRVEAVALSNETGTATLRVLLKDLGRSTVEKANKLDDPDDGPQSQSEVETRRLDDYGLQNLGFIKIDVEGHELAVLDGANETITRSRCPLIVETEDRHVKGATGAVFRWMRAHEYAGFFLNDRAIHPVESFLLDMHQNPRNIGGWRNQWVRNGLYVNNFIFVPRERIDSFLDGCHTLGFTTPENAGREHQDK